jgi:hypothetical protein
MRKTLTTLYGLALFLVSAIMLPFAVSADSSYNSGSYGSCQYNNCGITLTSSGTVALDVIPTAGTKCTVASDSASVLTDSSTGYTLYLNDFDTSNGMSGSSGGSINAVSGSASSPVTLSADTWGYRVDSALGFGAGPTSSQSSSSIPSQAFAFVPLSSSTGDSIATSASAADPAVATTVWYGLCADASVPNGSYTDSVVYTAVVN